MIKFKDRLKDLVITCRYTKSITQHSIADYNFSYLTLFLLSVAKLRDRSAY
ncbi:MAG: hypothetical protein ACJAXJ_004304 [Colwellia sp.]|jgi:hypothetical protein